MMGPFLLVIFDNDSFDFIYWYFIQNDNFQMFFLQDILLIVKG